MEGAQVGARYGAVGLERLAVYAFVDGVVDVVDGEATVHAVGFHCGRAYFRADNPFA